MSHTQVALDPGDVSTLKYIIAHVFFPLKLPDGNNRSVHNDNALARAVATGAHLYGEHVTQINLPQWNTVSRMLDNLQAIIEPGGLDASQVISYFNNMDVGDAVALFIRAQNAGVIFRKQEGVTVFESFELSPKAQDVTSTGGMLVCSYPGPAIEISNHVFGDKDFRCELVNFLVHMDRDDIYGAAGGFLERSFNFDVSPRYITELLTGILRGVGRPADISRISKRVGDDVVRNDGSKLPWRRSALWLLIKVALQTTLDRCSLGHRTYKEFMLFFMCNLAEERACAELPSDLLQCLLAKISRRLRKLGSPAPDWLTHLALQTCISLRTIIDNRWKQIQNTQRLSPSWNLSQLELTQDIQLSLSSSRDYLRNSLTNPIIPPPSYLFSAQHHPRYSLDDFLSSGGKYFEEAYQSDPSIALYDVEHGVEQEIDAWVRGVTNKSEACIKLEILANAYSFSAKKTYMNNPELLSVMLLTTIELWIALDKLAIKEIWMLADYSPEVPMSLLERLMHRKAASLYRIRIAYDYLSHRYSRSRIQSSALSSIATADSFAIRFYRNSFDLQRLKTEIEQVAQREVDEKRDELRKLNALYDLLRINEIVAGRVDDETKMDIGIHEWPLPADQLQAEAVVFELHCPVTFDVWRTATFHLLVDLCSLSVKKRDNGPPTRLNAYRAFKPYLLQHPRSRISLGSDAWSFSTPRRVAIPAKEEDVCLKNGMTFFAFDMQTGIPVAEALGISNSKEYGTYNLQRGPYYCLQKYVDSTSHTSNEVIANQTDAPEDLSIHEYMAFGHLRSGGLLQWLNILRELRARSLSFRCPEVHMLLAQAISQVGPLKGAEWTWHQEIQQPSFCYAILGELENLIWDVEANWTERVTMDTISLIIRRLLASSPETAVSEKAHWLLRELRGKVFTWIQELSVEVTKAAVNDEFYEALRDTAAICRGTFDVDPIVFPWVLRSAEDVEILLSSAIIIHDHTPTDVSRLPAYSQLLLDRDYRLSLAIESAVSKIILGDSSNTGINRAVSRIWPNYHPGSEWSQLPDPNSRWFSCTTAPSDDQSSQMVHLNILNGSLLVNGRPLGPCLPNEFVRHLSYRLIFAERKLAVLQSDLPGMDYCTRELIFDHLIHFSLRNNGRDLIIRAKRKRTTAGNAGIIELIPHEKLEGDLPAVLIEGHTHWLNLSTSIMEIRPLKSTWKSSSKNWLVDCTPGNYRMWKGNEHLIDLRSQSWNMVSSLLRPLCASQDLIVSVSPIDHTQPTSPPQLSVFLPRHDLSFCVDDDGDFQSGNIRGMVYDENQSIGTLFGLANQLVLRPKVKTMNTLGLIPRCVLVPDGDISFRVDGHHVQVEITPDRSSPKRVTYQTYWVNAELGCLTGNGSLTSKLYCAYLHALTSGSSDDPLTGRSGTEEALSILRSASLWSSMKFDARDAELLCLIASICPSRTWYEGQHAQSIRWQNLPATSQHHEFYVLSKAIKEHHDRAELFHEEPSKRLFEHFPVQDDHLLKRSARRATYVSPFGYSGQSSGAGADTQYRARDIVESASTSGEHAAYSAATLVYRRVATSAKNVVEMVESWKESLSGVSAETVTVLSLQYDRSWLAPDLPRIWLRTYNRLRESDDNKWFQLLFSLPAMAYASSKHSELVPIFVAFASHSQFRSENPPDYVYYPVVDGDRPSLDTLRKFVMNCARPLERSPEYQERARFMESTRSLQQRQRQMYDKRVYLDATATAAQMVSGDWPCETPQPYSLSPDLYDMAGLESNVQNYFTNLFRKLKLKEHLVRVQVILSHLHSHAPTTTGSLSPPYSFDPSQSLPSSIPWQLTIDQLFSRPAPPSKAHERFTYASPVENACPAHSSLHRLIGVVEESVANTFQRQYVSTLRDSAESFRSRTNLVNQSVTKPPDAKALVDHYVKCSTSFIEELRHIQQHMSASNETERTMEQSGQWPRFTPHILFRALASNSSAALPSDWNKYLLTFARLALELQRARRLVLLYSDNLHEEFCGELQNEGFDGWDAEDNPDWLLIQLQGNFLIRRVQVEVAKEMMSPRSGGNTAMQLNMGEGKTSVIVPIVAAVLANGDQLVRVIVPKPLVVQTFHILADRLGGLTNRRIYYLPFSRSLKLDEQKVASLRQIMLECMRERGVLVVQPEHVLSLKLVSVERQLCQAENDQVPHVLLELQKWLHSHSRDILDESDDILHVRSQLLFTVGRQQHVDGSPERWTTTEQVLNLVSKHALPLRHLYSLEVEYDHGPPGAFPFLRVLQADAGEAFISRIVQDVMDGLVPNISFAHLHFHIGLEGAIRKFISCQEVAPEDVQLVKKHFEKTSLWGGLLLLRGLLANHILLYVFRERRWRVDYGLFPTRTMLAVPYRAKDVPAQSAEFGHPDVAIILTYLSYYYDGLTEEQLRLSFDLLFKQHDPSSDYNFWCRECTAVPEFLRTFSSVNIESDEQWNKILLPLFSRNRATINFYLSMVVFCREAVVFPSKLSSSGWDLTETKDRPVTGFSGTNDGQYLFPLHIVQRDLDHQRGTNAMVLSYLLQPENKQYTCMTDGNDGRPTTHEFLGILVAQMPEIRVLLDVGAQMLDLQNRELAKAWLDITPDASAAIYFNEDDELMVCVRDGSTHPLRSSPFAQQIDRCVVYLDDAHTSGTDIKFPTGFRAAVTLGPRVTKDRLVQGCMRMRKLGHGHSVAFFAPLEVDRRIRMLTGKDASDTIDTVDILHWAIRETWENIQRWAPHWVRQGIDHASRYSAWSNLCSGQLVPKEWAEKWLQPEAKKLEDLYGPRNTMNFVSQIHPDIQQRCTDLGVQPLHLADADADEEQEREIVYEIERQVERRPPSVLPASHSIHPDVVNFVKTGVIPSRLKFLGTDPRVFNPAFHTLHATSAAVEEAYIWSQSLFATTDFERTVSESGNIDDYLRPVHWVVSAKRGDRDVLVILSPHEVNTLLPDIKSSKKVHLHVYTPRVTKSMNPCDDLTLYSIPMVPDEWTSPSQFMNELSVFAGQLYLKDYRSYIRLCRFLGLYAKDLEGIEGIVMEPDGFILPKNRNRIPDSAQIEIPHTFASSPLVSLRALMNLRCKGIDYTSTHMGKILHGRLLSEADFEY